MDHNEQKIVADMIIAAINNKQLTLMGTSKDAGKQLGEAFAACADEVLKETRKQRPMPR